MINKSKNTQNTNLECILIKLKDNVTPYAIDQLRFLLLKINGKKILEIGRAKAFIIVIPLGYKHLFESLQGVEFVGGVTLTPKTIRKIIRHESAHGENMERYIVKNNQIIKLITKIL